MRPTQFVLLIGAFVLASTFMAPASARQAAPAPAQPGPGAGRGGGAPAIVSPEVSTDRRITFRISAPQAKTVRVSAGDIPGLGQTAYIEKHYRVRTGRENRAIAGLSMGGSQTLNVAIPSLTDYAYIGVFSSGLIGGGAGRGRGAAPAADAPAAPATPFGEAWEKRNLAMLDNAAAKKGLKVFWFSTGKDDFLVENTRSTVELLKRHGFTPQYTESGGGHTWLNWRDYLSQFAPLLFQ